MITRHPLARSVAYGVFYRLPHPVRRALIKMIVPKYIVGAVTLVRDTEAEEPPGRLLLLRQPPGRSWSLPAGLLQRGETPVRGAARELGEETGIQLPADQLTPAVPNAVVHAKGWVDVVFEARVPASTTPLSVDGAEVLEAGWHRLDALPRLTGPTARLLAYYGIGPLAESGRDAPATDTGGGTQATGTEPDGTEPDDTEPDGTEPDDTTTDPGRER